MPVSSEGKNCALLGLLFVGSVYHHAEVGLTYSFTYSTSDIYAVTPNKFIAVSYYMIDAVFFVIHRSVFNINTTSFRSTVLQHGEGFDIQQGKAGLIN